ncbi:putative non-specific lipid-transfer protein [Apostichopus japonicus]|uniref:Putative non-specific lipid-transfer protein n=1 Tax=Stichopus japonicus TaxID=307972 RepID=A0A2G8JYT1_STIJA|nr:putative non-specific lipid-transfer protein [Apostichopus japonicus]
MENIRIRPVEAKSEPFKSEPAFKLIEEALQKDGANYVKKVKGIYSFNVTKGPGGASETWVVDVKNGNGSVERGSKAKADCTFTMTDSDLYDLMTGKLKAQQAFFSGKMKMKGNMGLAMKLQQIMPATPPAKL